MIFLSAQESPSNQELYGLCSRKICHFQFYWELKTCFHFLLLRFCANYISETTPSPLPSCYHPLKLGDISVGRVGAGKKVVAAVVFAGGGEV